LALLQHGKADIVTAGFKDHRSKTYLQWETILSVTIHLW